MCKNPPVKVKLDLEKFECLLIKCENVSTKFGKPSFKCELASFKCEQAPFTL